MTNGNADGRDDEAVLNAVGPAFSRLRRRTPSSGKDLSRNLVLNVVAERTGETTVGAVAEELGTDQSVASRMVSDCIQQGYLLREASQQDGRRTVLRLTPDGDALRDRFATEQRRSFERITRDWPGEERLRFARLLVTYAEDAASLRKQERS
ncbi:MarR family transcriptional regulator [Streptomyces sp. A0642]|uniref:MarR family winged helix-turn-helix transcriptional regulator n=1 Tax=unclassified Streptomyces TaxID=2593676 RepID=UPI0010A1FBBA|nr:MarR family winged helix-turn-helix transcriptional regulator [Streptomyces sp. A0642]THA79122.1 MarR family transcriptional regulator [Streptomyces sp. A0642]